MTEHDDTYPITLHLPDGSKAVVTETDTTVTPPTPEALKDLIDFIVGKPGPEVNPLERAIWRGDALINLGADKDEPAENQLSDVLADLMHWAEHNHVYWDDAIMHAHRARQAELEEWPVVQVSITNTYEDGWESEYEVWVPQWKGNVPDEEWWQDVVFPHTGDGHGEENPDLGSHYEATIIALSNNDTGMCGISNEWSD